MGLTRTLGASPAARACIACARPISPPSVVTTELLDMFCALKGATATPRRASHRQRPATSALLPASDVVPATSSAPRNPTAERYVPGASSSTSAIGALVGHRVLRSVDEDAHDAAPVPRPVRRPGGFGGPDVRSRSARRSSERRGGLCRGVAWWGGAGCG